MLAKLFLAASIILEVVGTLSLKYATVNGGMGGYIFMWIFIACSYICFSFAIKEIPMGVAYALWECFGLFFIMIMSFMFFGENITIYKIIGLIFLLLGAHLVSHGSVTQEKSNEAIKD